MDWIKECFDYSLVDSINKETNEYNSKRITHTTLERCINTNQKWKTLFILYRIKSILNGWFNC